MTIKLKPALAFFLLVGVPAIAGAVDTWEPYPAGPKTLEFYAVRSGIGSDRVSSHALGAITGMAWGIDPKTHSYLFTGMSSSDELRGGIDFLTLGLFHNIYGGTSKLDVYGELSAFGEGLGMVSRLGGFEYNFDLAGWGFFARSAWSWENDGDDGQGKAVVGRRARYTEGIYYQLGETVQLLSEITQESTSNFSNSGDSDLRRTSIAFGYNRIVSRTMEMILEARGWEDPEGGDRVWDFTLGAVLVW